MTKPSAGVFLPAAPLGVIVIVGVGDGETFTTPKQKLTF
jgi:hypothetical protein